MKKNIICPNCNNECYIALDGYGRTPYHIHCDNCHINIGTNNIENGISILENYHEKETYIEFYDNKVQYINKKNI